MSTSKGYLKDARGVDIRPGDVVIYGFGVSRSVAMAEGKVEADPKDPDQVSQTASGLVRVRVVRRSYSQGEKPVVAIMADRMVVLKPGFNNEGSDYDPDVWSLPPSPLPTQDELLYDRLVTTVERRHGDIVRLATGGNLDEHERRQGNYPDYIYAEPRDPERVAWYLGLYREWMVRDFDQLKDTCARLGRDMPFTEEVRNS